ncbi:MAG TPA: electron transfer flavoprotein subunit beta/FixA family protein [Bacteroidales bacterium]|nr:electron transfer flavoprotein subunit beta/FixA family protein [Bacteroidales bacterium]HPM40280.1 electron transfer flavoprotein subunit beta/FixA family protein [Bacteroidales bacterium]
MSLKIVVLAKQVPDTANVTQDAMKEDGTVNRAALPVIFNPEDLHALEMALRVKDKIKDSEVILLTMGPVRANEIIREALFRGADKGYLLTDRRFAGSDTLATSYALSMAIKKLWPVNLIFTGRQAIDGDTAQVGPQTAEKLGIPQITYAEELIDVDTSSITIKRRLDRGVEIIKSPLPCLITVNHSSPRCRFRNAKLVMKYKKATSMSELQERNEDYYDLFESKPYLRIDEWGVEDINADIKWLGLSGSPTKVKKIENVVFKAKENLVLTDNDNDIDKLMKTLINSHIIG